MISTSSLPAIVMSAVAFYVGVYHLFVWARSRQQRLNLIFALVCFATAAHDVCCAGLYNAGSIAAGAPWQRYKRLSLALEGLAFAWFVADYTRRAPRRLLYALSFLAVAYAALLAVAPAWVFSTNAASLTVTLPWGGAVTYHEMALRPPGYLLELFGAGLFWISFVAALRQYRSSERRPAARLLVVLLVLFAAVSNDAAVADRRYAFVYLIEYASLAIVILMAYSFAEQYRRGCEIEQGLREREQRYRGLIEGTEDLVLQIDSDRRIAFANPGAAAAFGVSREALVGAAIVDLVYPEERPRLAQALEDWFAGRSTLTSFEARYLTLAEQSLDVLWTVTPMADESGRPVSLSAIGRDITARNRADEEHFARLQRLERQQEALLRLATDESVVAGDVGRAAQRITEMAAETLGVDRVAVWRVTTDGTRITCVDLFERSRGRHSTGRTVAFRGSVYYERIVSDRAVVSNDAAQDPRLAELREQGLEPRGIGAVLDAPVRVAGWLAGTVRIEHTGEPRVWRDDEIVFAGQLADQATQVILNADRRKGEESLRASEARYRSMLDSMDDMVYIASDQYRIEYLNPAMVRRVGQGVLGELCYAGIHGLTGVCPWCTLLQTPAGPGARHEITSPRDERSYQVSHAEIRNIDSSLSRMFILRDVTESRHNESVRALLSAAIEQAAEMIVITDSDGVIQYVNPAFEQVTGYAGGEAVGRTPNILKSGRHDAAFYEDLWNTIRAGRTWNGRLTNNRKNGTSYVEEAVISPVLDRSGRIVNFVAVKRDITEQVQLEERLRQAQKMEAIGQLAGGVAHDFNNLLTPIIGYAELLQMRLAPEDPTHSALSEIRRAGEGARRLTAQLLAFSRKQVIEMRVFDLSTQIGRMRRMLRRTIREDIEIAFHRADTPTPVRGDASQVEQVVMNLVVNAQDAMPRGGAMTVEVANVVLDEVGLRAGPSLLPGPYVLLSVMDTGLGMDAETLAHIFEPFFTTKERGKGTGLGLATVYGIIRQHGGDVTVESEPDRGSTFRVYLPRASEGASTDERTGQSAETPGGKETILVVEDDESVRRLTCSVLRAHGYTVLAADGGQSALALMGVEQAPVHLLLTDVVMPGINARETYRRLVALRPGLKVLYMSGYTEDVLGPQGVLEEGVHLIGKPFTVEALTRKVREVLDHEA